MKSQKTPIALIALIPGLLLPVLLFLSRQGKENFLFGLSSDFYAGFLVALMAAAAIVAATLVMRDKSAKGS